MSNPDHPPSRLISTSIHIWAPLPMVRSILLDFASYPSWSSFITSIDPLSTSATPALGDTLNVTIHPPGSSAMRMKPTIVHLNETGFGWQSHLAGISGLFDGKHLFLLSEEEGGTKLEQKEEFGGILYAPVMNWMGVGEKTKKGFEEFNAAIKKKAEETAQAQTQAGTN